jgi:gamma-glutamylcyclotransferase (GGCT)/AIG2-like uncharacterized protein YtfP
MAERCRTAEPLCRAKIYNAILAFSGPATIVRSNNDAFIWGGLWEIEDKDEAALDYYEGFPYYYHKTRLNLQDGRTAMTYFIPKRNVRASFGISAHYAWIVAEGYMDFGLPMSYLGGIMSRYNWENPDVVWNIIHKIEILRFSSKKLVNQSVVKGHTWTKEKCHGSTR